MRRTDTSFPPSAPVHSRFFFFFYLNPERPVALICIRKKSFSAFPLCRMKSSSSQGGGGGGRGAEMGENNGGPPFTLFRMTWAWATADGDVHFHPDRGWKK